MFTRIFPALTPATRALILINVGVFLLQQLFGPSFDQLFALWPLGSGLFHPWQVLTYAFLHGGISHIVVNMFALFMFGSALESFWGPRRFIIYYLVCSLAAGLTQLAVAAPEATVGASGGIFGVLLAFAWYFPHQRVLLIFPPIPMPAWLFVTLYALLELYFGVSGRDQGVAHFAHLGGLVGGALCILYWRARGRFRH